MAISQGVSLSSIKEPLKVEVTNSGGSGPSTDPLAPNYVAPGNEFSTLNSTTTPLGTHGVFTGQWEDVTNYISINVLINTDRIAASGGLRMEFSTDGVNTDISRVIDITTGGDFVTFPCEAKFFRIVVTNGGGNQAFLRVQTHYSASPRSLKGVPLLDNITDASTATLTRTVIEGRSSQGGGTYVPVKVAPSGSLLADVSGSTVAVSNFPATQVVSATDLDIRNLSSAQDSVTVTGTVAVDQPVEVMGTQLDALTDTQLRASPVDVSDDYALGEVLPDQTGANNVLTFTFSQPVVSFWVAVVGDAGYVKIDHYGGTPSASSGIPVGAGGVLPIPEPTTSVKVFAPTGLVVTLWGQRRA